MPKTKTINLRIDEEKLAQIDALALKAKQSRSEYMVQSALREPATPAAEVIASLPALPIKVAANLPQPANHGDHPGPDLSKCPRCGAATIPWGPGRRCRTCARNYSAG